MTLKDKINKLAIGATALMAAATFNTDANAQNANTTQTKSTIPFSIGYTNQGHGSSSSQRDNIVNLLANNWESKEALVDGDYKIPFTINADTLELYQEGGGVSSALQGLEIRLGEEVYFEHQGQNNDWQRDNLSKLNPNESLNLANGAKIENKDGKILYITDEKTQQGVISNTIRTIDDGEGQDAVRLIKAHFSDNIEEYERIIRDLGISVEIARDNYIRTKDENQQLRNILNEQRQELQETKDDLRGYRFDRSMWNVSPIIGASTDQQGNPTYVAGIKASLPIGLKNNGINIIGLYSAGPTVTGEEDFSEIREALPDNRAGREGEAVSETTSQKFIDSYGVLSGLEFPVTTKTSLGPIIGYERSNIEEIITDESYFERDGEIYNKAQDRKTITDVQNDIRAGLTGSYQIGRINISVGADTNPLNPTDIKAWATIGYNLVNGGNN